MYKFKKRRQPRWKTRAVEIKKTDAPEQKRGFAKDFGFKAAKALDLPIDLVGGMPHLEISGNREAVVEGCRGILAYDEDLICLDLGKMKLRFMGRSLELRNFTDHSAIVDGYITSIEYMT